MKSLFFSIFFLLLTKNYGQDYYAFVTMADGSGNNAYLNDKGKITYREQAGEKIQPLSEGLGVIKKDGGYGFIDPFGHLVVPAQYDDAESFSEGLAAVKVNGKWGYINKKNEMVIQPTLISNKPFINKVAYYIDESMMKNNLYKFIDTTGHFINDEYYLFANKFSDHCAWVKSKNAKEWGCINTKGKYIIEPKYDRVTYFKNGRCWVEINKKWGYINKKGEYLAEPVYDDTNNELDGYTWVQKNGSWGLLDSTGKVVIPVNYKNAITYGLKGSFGYVKFATPSNGLLAFYSGTKGGYCNLEFKTIITPIYDEVTNFTDDGVAAVKQKDKWGLIDVTGKVTCDFKYKDMKYLGHGLFYSEEKNNNITIFDKTGKPITELTFLKVKKFEKN